MPLADLQRIGKEIAEAVLMKDVDGIVQHGRPDYVESDRAELQRPGSELYCYVFDTSCNFRNRPSVYEVLRKAGRLGVEAIYLGEARGRPNATIVFYDVTRTNKKALRSRSYLASKFGRELFTWRFEYVDGRWRAITPPFNAFTDL